ncbi:MAG: DUF4345 domain-containing protein [Deltaproteobacteria bacterium]|nr:DUF4345 domain-containing protein [Deltaproteobacteria bacterium]
MTIERLSLILSALVFGSFGFAFLFWPTTMAGFVDIELSTPTAIVDFQATYGGLELGLAIFFAYCAVSHRWVHPALLLQVLSLGGLAFGRVVGISQGESTQPIILWLLLAEVSGCALGLFALTRTTPTVGATGDK